MHRSRLDRPHATLPFHCLALHRPPMHPPLSAGFGGGAMRSGIDASPMVGTSRLPFPTAPGVHMAPFLPPLPPARTGFIFLPTPFPPSPRPPSSSARAPRRASTSPIAPSQAPPEDRMPQRIGPPLGWGAAARLGGKGREAVPRVRFGRWNGPPISSGRKEVRVAMEGRRGIGTTRTWGTQLLDGRATIATQPAIAQHFSAARGKGGGQACLPLHGGRRSGRGWRTRGLLVAPVLAAHLHPEATGGQDSTR